MQCPYCGKEMEKGLILSTKEISWVKGEKKKVFAKASLSEDSAVLSAYSFWKRPAVVAWRCAVCQKIVIDLADGKCDFNRK